METTLTLAALLRREAGLDPVRVELWIARGWVRPERRGGEPVFAEIDVARMRLIRDLHDEMDLGEEALPVVLHLLDQLHDTRRQLRALAGALDEEARRRVLERLLG